MHPSSESRETFWTKPVHYRWTTPDGAIHKASTVLLSRSRGGLRAAFKRFWTTNRHVDPDQDFTRLTAHKTHHHAY